MRCKYSPSSHLVSPLFSRGDSAAFSHPLCQERVGTEYESEWEKSGEYGEFCAASSSPCLKQVAKRPVRIEREPCASCGQIEKIPELTPQPTCRPARDAVRRKPVEAVIFFQHFESSRSGVEPRDQQQSQARTSTCPRQVCNVEGNYGVAMFVGCKLRAAAWRAAHITCAMSWTTRASSSSRANSNFRGW